MAENHLSLIPGGDQAFARYRRLRGRLEALCQILAKTLSRSAMQECAKKLGLLQGKVLVFDREDEVAVLFDYCLFCHRVGGRNAIERYLRQHPPPPGSDDALLFKALAESWYSLFEVEAADRNYGVRLLDLVRQERYPLMDRNLSLTAMPGLCLAGRILSLSDFCMASGAFLPIADPGLRQLVLAIAERFVRNRLEKGTDQSQVVLTAAQEAAFAAQVIRAALRAGAMEQMRYAPPRPRAGQ